VSLDGGEEHNDYLRGKGNFKKAIESIKSLKLADCRVTINSGITSITTEEDIRTLLDFAGEYCDNISFFYIRPLGRALNIKDKLLNFYELSKLMKKIDSIKREYFPPELSLKDNKQVLNSIGQDHARNFNLMRGGVDGFTRFNILPNGDLYAGGCALYVNEDLKEELKLENIVKEGFSILNVWRFNPKLMGIRKKSSELQKQCEECKEYKLDCSGFTLEMELYGGLNPEGNPYCNKK
jgi:radical SAM protein with 4Fe4S-binding SPASM domain